MPISTHKCRGYPLSPAWPDDIVLFLIILRPPCHGEITCLCQVMCDLFCIDDAVRSGTTAVLSSLQDSHAALMTNLQALLDYQTQYLLWATVLNMDVAPTGTPQPNWQRHVTIISRLKSLGLDMY